MHSMRTGTAPCRRARYLRTLSVGRRTALRSRSGSYGVFPYQRFLWVSLCITSAAFALVTALLGVCFYLSILPLPSAGARFQPRLIGLGIRSHGSVILLSVESITRGPNSTCWSCVKMLPLAPAPFMCCRRVGETVLLGINQAYLLTILSRLVCCAYLGPVWKGSLEIPIPSKG
ncbi:hypothetical protein BDV96DRAFT_384199 [Lophiotrema nucula]|uniref:Uncharacterized protein n=1 Tax=Lophiotrema nucula TaxID=690887 RepID=A0A6A5ZFV9_9PLEO|nr:hypothetical protein BDV96DRAFT_384199 [Lophiotrema nucula]